MPCLAIGAQMSSGQRRLLACGSERRKAPASTHNVQARMRQLRDAPGQTARYALTEMRDPNAALARWVSRAPLWLGTLSLRRDLALPLVVLAVQLTGAAVSDQRMHIFNPPHALGALGWVLLAAGPVALVARRRHPVPVLWVNVAGTLPWSSAAGWAHISFIVAFFAAATAGKRYSAWLALAICFAWTIWLAPLVAVVPGRRGIVVMAMLALAMCMTQIWYPLGFEQLKELRPLESWAVVGRNLVLLALFVTLALADVPVLRIVQLRRTRRAVVTAVS